MHRLAFFQRVELCFFHLRKVTPLLRRAELNSETLQITTCCLCCLVRVRVREVLWRAHPCLPLQNSQVTRGENVGGWDTSSLWTTYFLLKRLKVVSKKASSHKNIEQCFKCKYPKQPKVSHFFFFFVSHFLKAQTGLWTCWLASMVFPSVKWCTLISREKLLAYLHHLCEWLSDSVWYESFGLWDKGWQQMSGSSWR